MGKWDNGAEYLASFSNVVRGTHQSHYFAIILTPSGLKKTIEQIELYYTSPKVTNSAFDNMRATNSAMRRTVFAEDIYVVEGMQQGRRTPAYDGGKSSAMMDGPTYHFHKWVAHKLGSPA